MKSYADDSTTAQIPQYRREGVLRGSVAAWDEPEPDRGRIDSVVPALMMGVIATAIILIAILAIGIRSSRNYQASLDPVLSGVVVNTISQGNPRVGAPPPNQSVDIGAPTTAPTTLVARGETPRPAIAPIAPTTTEATTTTTEATTTTTGELIPESSLETAPPSAPNPTQAPTTAPLEVPDPPQPEPFYANCDAARAAGVAPINLGEPGYRAALDRDSDGIACEDGNTTAPPTTNPADTPTTVATVTTSTTISTPTTTGTSSPEPEPEPEPESPPGDSR